ncbi:MAG: HNH endonuclease [Lachnospiraceae bacterium]|nr:HNH endonuclease [Lachnospiraceae bacterium]MCI1726906.1 HNH endonuclease [Lachnospiraceae bacterium]
MINLPESSALPIQSFSRIFNDMSESYKIFWFKGVLDFAMNGKESATFSEIIHHMITEAWYMVSEYHLNLGPMDTLEKLVLDLQGESGLTASAEPRKIHEFLVLAENDSDTKKGEMSKRLKKYETTLTNMVPYRLQAPFLHDVKGSVWGSTKDVITRVNLNPSVIYHFGEESGLDRTIHIQKDWMDYLTRNQAIISGWINYNLVCYLQKRNPSVPGISDKLKPPTERKMEKAKNFWRAVAEHCRIRNIYAHDMEIIDGNKISLDHFVPWSYVAHDELWDLVPTTKSINSSKGNNLPNWKHFFPLLCEEEYKSYCAIWENEHIRTVFDKCEKEHVNSDEVREKLYAPGIEREAFEKELSLIVKPSYQSAKNLGFAEWKYE